MKFLFFGDFVIKNIKDFSLSVELQELISSHDKILVNFEGTLTTAYDTPISKVGPHIANCKDSILSLKNKGVNIFTLANNHILDFGYDSFKETILSLKESKIDFLGAGFSFEDCYAPLLIETSTEKIALINCCHAEFGVYKDKNIPLRAGYAWINNKKIDENIRNFHDKGYKVIVLPHAGLENSELPLPEWRDRYKEFINAGADIVIGGHPHIIQGKEIHKNHSIYFSLGNFCFYNNDKIDSLEWNAGLVVSYDTSTNLSQEYFIEYKNKEVILSSSALFKEYFKRRSSIFYNETLYNTEITNIIKDVWFKTYKPLYEAVPNFIDCRHGLLKNLLKYFAKKLIFKKHFNKDLNETLLLHNIQIETHRYIVERYLYLNNVKKNMLK